MHIRAYRVFKNDREGFVGVWVGRGAGVAFVGIVCYLSKELVRNYVGQHNRCDEEMASPSGQRPICSGPTKLRLRHMTFVK